MKSKVGKQPEGGSKKRKEVGNDKDEAAKAEPVRRSEKDTHNSQVKSVRNVEHRKGTQGHPRILGKNHFRYLRRGKWRGGQRFASWRVEGACVKARSSFISQDCGSSCLE